MPCERIVQDPRYGIIVCEDTGEVISDEEIYEGRIDGSTVTARLHDMGIGASIGGRRAGFEYRDRTMITILTALNEACNQIGAPPPACETAARSLSVMASNMRTVKLRLALAAACASLYLALTSKGVYTDLDYVCEYLDADSGDAVKLITRMGHLLGHRPRPLEVIHSAIYRISASLGLDRDVESLAHRLCMEIYRAGYRGRPSTTAAACVYTAQRILRGSDTNIDSIASAIGVKSQTLRKTLAKILSHVEIRVNLSTEH